MSNVNKSLETSQNVRKTSFSTFFEIFLYLVLLVVLATTLMMIIQLDTQLLVMSKSAKRRASQTSLKCSNVLKTMVRGKWARTNPTMKDLANIRYFLNQSRVQFFMPQTLQRLDGRCGNVTFDSKKIYMTSLMWFRALCDPEGDLPCCYNNKCVSRTEEDCRCEHCYDMRQPINAEFATWIPDDPNCRITTFKKVEETCKTLHNMTIYMIGDSFLRHMYINLLTILRQRTRHGPLRANTSSANITICHTDFVYLRMCKHFVDRDTRVCNNTVKLKFMEHPAYKNINATLKSIIEIIDKPNSLLLAGIGVHNNYSDDMVAKEYITPLLQRLSKSQWPKLVWAWPHAPGLLKSPRYPSQSKANALKYIDRLRPIFESKNIPVFDTFQLTDGMMSFDGVHYGRGINSIKVQIFLNYILELRENKDIF